MHAFSHNKGYVAAIVFCFFVRQCFHYRKPVLCDSKKNLMQKNLSITIKNSKYVDIKLIV